MDLHHNGTDWAAGITVETNVIGINGEGLGLCVAELTSPVQADFLIGLARRFQSFSADTVPNMQLAYIADHFKDSPTDARLVCDLLTNLAEFIDEAVARDE